MTGSTEGLLTADGAVRFTITPHSDYFAPHDEKTVGEGFELEAAMARKLPDAMASRPAPGQKGVLTDVLIPLGSSGALTATVEVFKAWLAKRPTHRTIDVEFEIEQGDAPKRTGTFSVDATNVDDAVLDTIAKEVL